MVGRTAVQTRRHFTWTMLAAGGAPLLGQQAPAGRLVPWMYMIFPIEQWLTDYQRTMDAWAEGGVRGIVIGPIHFYKEVPRFEFTYSRPGTRLPAFPPEPAMYRKYGVDPPLDAPRDPLKEKQLQGLVENAARRGWEVIFFGPGHYGRRKSFEQDPFGAASLAAGIEDTMRAFPQAKGVLIDGAGEHSYELAFHHGGEVLDIPDSERAIFQHLKMDVARMDRGITALRERMHSLTPAMVRYYAPGGMMGAQALFGFNEDVAYWLRCRQEGTLQTLQAMRKLIDGIGSKPKFATIPRTASFSLMTTQ